MEAEVHALLGDLLYQVLGESLHGEIVLALGWSLRLMLMVLVLKSKNGSACANMSVIRYLLSVTAGDGKVAKTICRCTATTTTARVFCGVST